MLERLVTTWGWLEWLFVFSALAGVFFVGVLVLWAYEVGWQRWRDWRFRRRCSRQLARQAALHAESNETSPRPSTVHPSALRRR